MTLDSILRKYVADAYPDVQLDPGFKLYIDSDGDIVYIPEGHKYPDYFYTSEDGQLIGLIDFILNEAGVK